VSDDELPPMRAMFFQDWVMASRGALVEAVERHFTYDAHRWPLLRAYEAEGLVWRRSHLVLVLRDRLSGIPVMGPVRTLHPGEGPDRPPTPEHLDRWFDYYRGDLGIRPQDMAVAIPLDGLGPNVEEDWET